MDKDAHIIFGSQKQYQKETSFIFEGLKEYNQNLLNQKSSELVAFYHLSAGGEIQAGLIGEIIQYDHYKVGWIREIFDQKYWGEGSLLSLVIQNFEKYAFDKGCQAIQLESFPTYNEEFFTQLGYQPLLVFQPATLSSRLYFLQKRRPSVLNQIAQIMAVPVSQEPTLIESLVSLSRAQQAQHLIKKGLEEFVIFSSSSSQYLDGGMVGYLVDDTAILMHVFVAAEARNKGIGAALFRQTMKVLAERGCQECFWGTLGENAKRFYERQGAFLIGAVPKWQGSITHFFFTINPLISSATQPEHNSF